MSRGTWVWCDTRQKIVPKGEQIQVEKKRSSLAAPMIRPDGMDDTWNPADGKHYSSKAGYEKAVRRAGCEIVGNEKMPEKKPYQPEGVGRDIKQAIEQLS